MTGRNPALPGSPVIREFGASTCSTNPGEIWVTGLGPATKHAPEP